MTEQTALPIDIIFEDSDLLVLNKPVGVVVNDSETQFGATTLESLLKTHYPSLEEGLSVERSGIVHRLDKDTSGLLVIAKTGEAQVNLQAQFKVRSVKKTYLALVTGIVKETNFSVNAPIGRNPKNRMKFCVNQSGKPAYTDFKKLKELTIEDQNFTLLEAYPQTGRTHQIRVHLAALNHHIVGDVIYSGSRLLSNQRKLFTRLMLHAYKISFKHPVSGKLLDLEAPLPEEFKKLL